jgi:MinD superfamily P-loop ATPase
MSFSVAIASGKGGTGKTTVAVSLFNILSGALDGAVMLVDCDVEEPNDQLFFPKAGETGKKQVLRKVPVIDTQKCTWCRRCVEYCAYNAIVVLPGAAFAEINPDLCHSCGACLVACTDRAISEAEDVIGTITRWQVANGPAIVEGRLHVGSTMQTMMIRELKKSTAGTNALRILDAPPGTSCPVVETISDTDFVLLVTEPTPFGFHDLKLMIEVVKEMRVPYGVVINKTGIGTDDVYDYLSNEEADILGEIPFSRAFAGNYAEGALNNAIPREVKQQMEIIASHVLRRIGH